MEQKGSIQRQCGRVLEKGVLVSYTGIGLGSVHTQVLLGDDSAH